MLLSKSVWGEKKERGEGEGEGERERAGEGGEKARDIRSFLRQRKERHPPESETSPVFTHSFNFFSLKQHFKNAIHN